MDYCCRCLTVLAFSVVYCRAAGPQPPPFRAEVNMVNITAVVRSADGKLVRNLTQDDFEVIEDGIPQTIRFFARETELPLSLGLIIDVSGSQDKFLKQHNHDVETFLNTVLRPSDQVFAVCFGNHLRLVGDGVSSASAIVQGLERFQKGAGHFPEIGPKEDRDLGTALYDAVYFSIAEKLKTAGERRRALLVFSDGEENSSEHDLLDAIETAQNTDTLVYSIRYTQKKHGQLTARNKYGMRVMAHLSSLTGAADFDALGNDLDTVFTQISDELRAMYQIGYVPGSDHAHDGSFRKVTVRCKQPETVVRSKRGYYAR
jgi:Ca-activated chloride channel family protein